MVAHASGLPLVNIKRPVWLDTCDFTTARSTSQPKQFGLLWGASHLRPPSRHEAGHPLRQPHRRAHLQRHYVLAFYALCAGQLS